ncbi:MAG TPA: hypothetical protein VF950_29565 [Planctomycetota bacterium]
MGRYTPQERAYLVVSSAIVAMGLLAALPLVLWLAAPEPFSSESIAPPPAPPSHVGLRGRLVDLTGFNVPPGILGHTRVVLLRDGVPLGDEVIPEDDGVFLLAGLEPLQGQVLRVSTLLRVNLSHGTLDRPVTRDMPLDASRLNLGDIPLPRAEDFGLIDFRVVDAEGAILHPEWVGLEAVEGTSTPPVSVARLDELDVGANAPVEYRRGGRGTILHVPRGEYWLRAAAFNRLLPAVRISVGSAPVVATIAERAATRRIRGVIREMGAGWPLEDVRITVSSATHAGAESRDPARVIGRSLKSGAYDLPILDPLPAGGLRLSFVRPGYSGSELKARPEDFKGGKTLVLDLDLGRD